MAEKELKWYRVTRIDHHFADVLAEDEEDALAAANADPQAWEYTGPTSETAELLDNE